MAAFSIAPVGGAPPATDTGWPRFIQFQSAGVDLGGPDADTVDFATGLSATRGTGENENVVTVVADPAPALTWRHIDGDGIVTADDVANGISMDASSGGPVLVVPPGVIPSGQSVLVLQRGAAQVSLPAQSGIDFVYRDTAFQAAIAGQGGILTLIGLDDGSVLLCGDLATV